jgi:enediyne biosynthesis protein E4
MKALFLSLIGCQNITSDLASEKSDSAQVEEETLEPTYRTRESYSCLNPELHFQSPISLHSLGPDWENQPLGTHSEKGGWGLSVNDFNGDGNWDIFLPHFGPDQLFFGNSDGSVSEESDRLPNLDSNTFGAAASDFDGDGRVDILLANNGNNYILKNEERTHFSYIEGAIDIDEAPVYRTQQFAVGDYDSDGYFDLFGPTFYSDLNESQEIDPGPNLMLHGVGEFVWEGLDGLPETLFYSPANAGGWVDIDDDSDLDLFVINDKPSQGFKSGVYLNNEHGWSVLPEERGLSVMLEGMGLAWGDLNNDGHIDFGITGWGVHSILINSGENSWFDATQQWGLTSSFQRVVGWGISFVDMDNDGDQDVLVAYGPAYQLNGDIGMGFGEANSETQYLTLYLNDGEELQRVSNEHWDFGLPGNFRGFVTMDWNKDGYLDVLARDLNGKARYYQSNCGINKSIEISLNQPGMNAKAIGARIWVKSPNENSRFRDITAGSENLSSTGPPVAHFGLGDAEFVDIVVRWPDGAVSSINDVPTQQWIEIDR